MSSLAVDEDKLLRHITDGLEKVEAEMSDKNFPQCDLIEEREDILDSRMNDCDALAEELKKEKHEINGTLSRIRADLIHLKQDPEEQMKLLKEFDEELSSIVTDLDNMEEARRQVNSITQQQFALLKNLRRPPKVLEQVLIGVAYLFGVKPGDGDDHKSNRKKQKYVEWPDAKRFIIQMETKDKILRFNPLMCKMEDIAKTRSWIRAHSSSFQMSRIKRASKSFAPLAVWLNLSMEMAEKYKRQDTMDLNVRRITLTQRANLIRKQLARSKKDTNYIEDMEKKVASIYAKQSELEGRIKHLRRQLGIRRGQLPEVEMKGEDVSLQRVGTHREEFQTQIFFDWKNMMQGGKKKRKRKKKKKKKKKKKNGKAEVEEVKVICRLSGLDPETMEAAHKQDRESYNLDRGSRSTIRRLTGLPQGNDTDIKVWREGEGWVVPDDDEKKVESPPVKKASTSRRALGSALVMKGLIRRLKSESRARQSVSGNDLIKFLSMLRSRLDKIDIELEQKQKKLREV